MALVDKLLARPMSFSFNYVQMRSRRRRLYDILRRFRGDF